MKYHVCNLSLILGLVKPALVEFCPKLSHLAKLVPVYSRHFNAGPFILLCTLYPRDQFLSWITTCLRLKKLFLGYQGFQWMSSILWIIFCDSQIFDGFVQWVLYIDSGQQQGKKPSKNKVRVWGFLTYFAVLLHCHGNCSYVCLRYK